MSTTYEDYLDLDTVAKQLDISVATLRSAIDNEELKAIKGVWRGYRTTDAWIQEWLDRKTVNKAGGDAA